MDQKLYWIWLSTVYRPGAVGFLDVLEAFASPYRVYQATEKELADRLGEDFPTLKKLADKRLDEAYRIYDYCEENRVALLTYADLRYPSQLRMIPNPPLLLYCLGKFPSLSRKLCVGIVGTRSMSEYGKRMTYKLSHELASAGVVTVSGMALGCDGVAAAATIQANGTTLAVLGCGIDIVYPRQHENLRNAISHYGAVLTEYPPGSPPDGAHFPVRNRIISGLSHGIVVIEGNARSGSLLTAGHAEKQGRPVFAVPGNLDDPNAQGPNELIRRGATIVRDTSDILESLTKQGAFSVKAIKPCKASNLSVLCEAALSSLGVCSATVKVSRQVPESPARTVPTRTPPAEATRKAPPQKPQSGGTPQRHRFANVPHTADAEQNVPTLRRYDPNDPRMTAHPEADRYSAPEPPDPKRPHTPPPEERDVSERLSSISDNARLVYEQVPKDRPVSTDYLVEHRGSIGNALLGIAELEIAGLIVSLPGGLYIRK